MGVWHLPLVANPLSSPGGEGGGGGGGGGLGGGEGEWGATGGNGGGEGGAYEQMHTTCAEQLPVLVMGYMYRTLGDWEIYKPQPLGYRL